MTMLAVAVAVCSSVLTGCGAPTVAIDDYSIAASDTAQCRSLIAAMPGEVATQGRRVVEPTTSHIDDYSAVWGDPVIAMKCGLAAPAGYIPVDGDLVVDGITWRPLQLSHGYQFFAQGLVVPLSVTVPSEYAPETNALADISPALAKYVKP